MFCVSSLAQTVRLRASLLLASTLAFASLTAHAQAPIHVLDAAALHPPAGARVAIVEFDDLECPACATVNPTLRAAATQYKIPWVRHDFLIPYHSWSRNAAINARWFDLKSKALGDEYRDQVFANQRYIYNPGSLAEFTQSFARNHGVTLPFNVDPRGDLANEVEADVAIGRRTGINSTPTVFVVTANSKGAPYIQVLNPALDLYTTIDRAITDTTPAPKAAPPKKPSGK